MITKFKKDNFEASFIGKNYEKFNCVKITNKVLNISSKNINIQCMINENSYYYYFYVTYLNPIRFHFNTCVPFMYTNKNQIVSFLIPEPEELLLLFQSYCLFSSDKLDIAVAKRQSLKGYKYSSFYETRKTCENIINTFNKLLPNYFVREDVYISAYSNSIKANDELSQLIALNKLSQLKTFSQNRLFKLIVRDF